MLSRVGLNMLLLLTSPILLARLHACLCWLHGPRPQGGSKDALHGQTPYQAVYRYGNTDAMSVGHGMHSPCPVGGSCST